MNVFDTIFKWIKTGATDDAAAAGEIFPAAGLYQATVDEVDDGDVGRIRMTERRASIVCGDAKYQTGTFSFAAESGAKQFNIAWPAWVREVSINLNNEANQAMDVSISLRDFDSLISSNSIFGQLYSASADLSASGGRKTYAPGAGGTGAGIYEKVEALRGNYLGLYLRVVITPGGAATGDVNYLLSWSG
jgi:hypothetical protein